MFICVTLYQWHSSFTHYVLDSFVSCLATKGGFLLVWNTNPFGQYVMPILVILIVNKKNGAITLLWDEMPQFLVDFSFFANYDVRSLRSITRNFGIMRFAK